MPSIINKKSKLIQKECPQSQGKPRGWLKKQNKKPIPTPHQVQPILKKFIQGNLKKYQIVKILHSKKLGHGHVAQLISQSNQQFIGKFIPKSKQNQAVTEIFFLNLLKSKFICNIVQFLRADDGFWIILEKGAHTLNDYQIKKQQVQTVLNNIATTYLHLYNKKVAHRDLKMANIIIEKDLTIKLIDMQTCEYNMQVYGTLDYLPPQILQIKWNQCDAWAYGVIARKLCSFCGLENSKIGLLIEKCLQQNMSQRWGWEQIFKFWSIQTL